LAEVPFLPWCIRRPFIVLRVSRIAMLKVSMTQ
jgi:hypothetical protein